MGSWKGRRQEGKMTVDNFTDQVVICLGIESVEMTAAAVTARLGVVPDSQWSRGALRGRTGKRWECHGWVLEVCVRAEELDGGAVSYNLDERSVES